ncbi:MAG: ABC transporter substrate-binding protein [Treponema sp.]|jgi:sn-glycerol 3-phosphate transport system substrate-binding protein|nr:ABC transporter substrate-binding protein [Treponema sp.]
MKAARNVLFVLCLICLCAGAVSAGGGNQGRGSGPVTVQFHYNAWNTGLEVIAELIDEFNASQSEVVIEGSFGGGWEESNKKLLASLVAGDTPALAMVAMAYNAPFLVEGHFEDLSAYMAKDTEVTESDFMKALLDLNRYNGKVYGLPLACSAPILYYNKDIFRKAGLDPDKPPAAWNDVYSYAQKIRALGPEYTGLLFNRSNGYISMGMVRAFGSNWIAQDNSTVLWTDKGAVEALQLVQKIHNEGLGVYQGDEASMVGSGMTGMWVQTCADVGKFLRDLGYDWGNAPLPAQVTQSEPIGGGSIYMFKNSPQAQKDGAWKFMKFLVSPESQSRWSSATGYVFTTQAALNYPAVQDQLRREPRYGVVYGPLAEYAVAQDTTQLIPFVEVLDIFNKLWDDTILNNGDAVRNSAEAQAQANRIIAPYKK